jgi:ankyrin repeat protein
LQELLKVSKLDITKVRDEMGYTLIHLATYNNAEKCLQVLCNHILNKPLNDIKGDDAVIKKNLLKAWINMTTIVPDFHTSRNEIASGENNLKQYTSLESFDSCGFTALHFASYHGNPRIIDILMECGANAYATNKQEINMLHVAA